MLVISYVYVWLNRIVFKNLYVLFIIIVVWMNSENCCLVYVGDDIYYGFCLKWIWGDGVSEVFKFVFVI